MSLQDELDRLDEISNSGATAEQRQKAADAFEKLIDGAIADAWTEIENRTAEYGVLLARLTQIVDDISANRLTSAIDDINGVLTDIQNAANGSSE